MSPAISMSCKTILPALLNLRSEMEACPKCRFKMHRDRHGECCNILPFPDHPIKLSTIRELKEGKEPRLSMGQEALIYWHQRTSPKNTWFCSECGERTINNFYPAKRGTCYKCGKIVDIFPKLITTVKITRVDIIEICANNSFRGGFSMSSESPDFFLDTELITEKDGMTTIKSIQKLTRDDGFQTIEQFWDYFNKYDLSKPRRFVRYFWG